MLQIFFVIFLIASPFHGICSDTMQDVQGSTAGTDIRIHCTIDMYNFTDFSIITKIEIRAVNLHEINSTLPEQYIYADQIRENISNGVINISQIERAYVRKIVDNITQYFTQKFGTNYTVSQEWDRGTLTLPPAPPVEEPPLIYYVNYTLRQDLGDGVDTELIVGLLNAGASYTQHYNSMDLKYPSAINLTLPEGVIVKGFPFPTNGTWLRRHYYTWNASSSVTLELTGAYAKKYSAPDVAISVVIDMHTLANINGNEYLYTSVNISADMRVIEVPDSLKTNFPSGFKMDFVCADAVRLIIAKNIVNLSYIYDVLNATLEYGKENLAEMFGQRIEFKTGEIVNTTWDENRFEMDSSPPISFSVTGNSTLDFGTYVKNYRQSLALTYSYSLNLLAVTGFNITYTIIFPKNIEIVSVECNAPHWQHYIKGRDAVSVNITNSSEMLRILIRISFDIDFERMYPFIVLLAILTGIWIGVSILAHRKKREEHEG